MKKRQQSNLVRISNIYLTNGLLLNLLIFQNGIDITEELQNNQETITTDTTTSTPHNLTLSELFHELHDLSQQISASIRYAVNKCKLDAVFERIIDKSDEKIKANGYSLQSPALDGSASTGYIHNGYIETETVT